MKNSRNLVFLASIFFSFNPGLAMAENGPISISGEITSETADAVERRLRNRTYHKPQIIVSGSPGGDVYAAMRIGSMLRLAKASIKVEGECNSACAIIYFGAVKRQLKGTLGLHRPYLSRMSGFLVAPTQSEIKDLYDDVAEYSDLMNISPSVVERMLSTPPEEMLIFDEETISDVVPGTDPAHREWEVAHDSTLYGIDTVTVRSRAAAWPKMVVDTCYVSGNVDRECFFEIKEAAMWGISVADFRERHKIALEECAFDDTARRSLQSEYNKAINLTLDTFSDQPLADFYLSPWLIWQAVCRQQVMGDL